MPLFGGDKNKMVSKKTLVTGCRYDEESDEIICDTKIKHPITRKIIESLPKDRPARFKPGMDGTPSILDESELTEEQLDLIEHRIEKISKNR